MAKLGTKKAPRWALVTGGLGLAGGLYLLTRKRKVSLPETPLPEAPPPTEIPEIDPILNEIDQAIAKLREIIEFLRKSVEGADELIKANEAAITDAQNAINEVKPKIASKTVTQQDAEQLLMVLEKIVNQCTLTNTFLVTLVNNVNAAIQKLTDTVNNLEKQIQDLKYMLEPIPARASSAAGGTTGRSGSHSTGFALSVDQEVTVSGLIEATGSWPFGCCNAAVYIRDRNGKNVKAWTIINACCHFFGCDHRRQPISEKIKLSRGMYSLSTDVWGTGGGGGASAQLDYRTARFIVEGKGV